MFRCLIASLGLMAGVPVAHAVEATSGALEVLVVDDPFARWDGTRWRIDTQVSLPYPVPLYKEHNAELHIVAYDLAVVVGCSLGEVRNRRIREVDCVVEDAALSAAPWRANPKGAAEVVAENSDRLVGLTVRLQVAHDGRVTGIQLAHEPQGSRRLNIQYENLRQVLGRAFVGFHLQSPDRFVMGEQWVERNSALFSLPSFRFLPIGVFADVGAAIQVDGLQAGSSPGQFQTPQRGLVDPAQSADVRGLGGPQVQTYDLPQGVRGPLVPDALGRSPWDVIQAPASYGRSVVAHRMDPYKGRYVVQSTGEGTVDIGLDVPLTFQGDLDAVSVYRPDDGVMTERVWSILLAPTPGSMLADGGAGWAYRQTGKLRMLAPDEEAILGASAVVSPPGPHTGRGQLLPAWPML